MRFDPAECWTPLPPRAVAEKETSMTPVAYVAVIRQDGPHDFIVTFPDVPEAITQGSDLGEARLNAHDALSAALDTYLEIGRNFPPASDVEMVPPGSTTWLTAVEPKLAARAHLSGAMKAQGISKVGLAKLMKRDEKAVRLILSGRGASLDMTLEALRAVGVLPAFSV